MMGEKEQQSPLWNCRVNLDKRVRRDHPLRRINKVLDFKFRACTGGPHLWSARQQISATGSHPAHDAFVVSGGHKE